MVNFLNWYRKKSPDNFSIVNYRNIKVIYSLELLRRFYHCTVCMILLYFGSRVRILEPHLKIIILTDSDAHPAVEG